MRIGVLASTLAALLLASFPFVASAGPSPDMDSDGTIDVFDTCKLETTVPNPCDLDTDKDGYGNFCDADFQQDTLVAVLDFIVFLPDFLAGVDLSGTGTDMNCDTLVNVLDFQIFLPKFLAGTPPGPSGLPCAGTPACHP